MPRAHRHFLPDLVWHITHRCHQREFLLKFSRDRQRYLRWLFEAKKRFGLCVLNYIVTANHIHLLVQDQGKGEIAESMQLIAGRTAQEYNRRKGRKGAFWEDRYHATAVDSDDYLTRCIVYIDLNMVRAGVVPHPGLWRDSGFREMRVSPTRYGIVASDVLMRLLSIEDLCELREARVRWVEGRLGVESLRKNEAWSRSLAVGSESFVDRVKNRLGVQARYRKIVEDDGQYRLEEPSPAYDVHFGPETGALSAKIPR